MNEERKELILEKDRIDDGYRRRLFCQIRELLYFLFFLSFTFLCVCVRGGGGVIELRSSSIFIERARNKTPFVFQEGLKLRD